MKEARRIRKLSPHENMRICAKSDWDYILQANDELVMHNENLMRNYRLAYDCIESMGEGKSRCPYCMEYGFCESAKRDKPRGCKEWVLKFPEEEKNDVRECCGAEEGRVDHPAEES